VTGQHLGRSKTGIPSWCIQLISLEDHPDHSNSAGSLELPQYGTLDHDRALFCHYTSNDSRQQPWSNSLLLVDAYLLVQCVRVRANKKMDKFDMLLVDCVPAFLSSTVFYGGQLSSPGAADARNQI
jgi:hypothetical protein